MIYNSLRRISCTYTLASHKLHQRSSITTMDLETKADFEAVVIALHLRLYLMECAIVNWRWSSPKHLGCIRAHVRIAGNVRKSSDILLPAWKCICCD
jgi:hypothetical protein